MSDTEEGLGGGGGRAGTWRTPACALARCRGGSASTWPREQYPVPNGIPPSPGAHSFSATTTANRSCGTRLLKMKSVGPDNLYSPFHFCNLPNYSSTQSPDALPSFSPSPLAGYLKEVVKRSQKVQKVRERAEVGVPLC